jgi:C4-dicarboxylate transporter, DctQ subunit
MMERVAKLLAKGAEAVAVAMLAAMFLAFIVQIVFRYALNLPVGWTHELSIVLWIWLVLWGAAFVLREREEIRFDLIYGGVGDGTRRVMCLITAVGLVGLYLVSLPAVVDYVTFMRVQRTAYMKIRFDWLYAVYVIFAVAAIARYLWLGWRALKGGGPEAFDPTKANSGV